MTLWLSLAVLAILLIYVIALYNRLVSFRQRVSQAWSDVNVQMKRRYDLIPNLVETVKGYAAHEKETLEKVIAARNEAVATDPSSPDAKAASEFKLGGALTGLLALAENYPDLKANQNFLSLQHELADTENRIQSSRRFYNGSVKELNTAVQSFPSNLVARPFNFTEAQFFELNPSESAAVNAPVKVDFQ
ncbi:MAG: LemA family protein [Devosia sp.]